MGALFDSPMRRRVRASWAFVGSPLRIVLLVRMANCRGGLFDFEYVFPVGVVLV